ncbi:MAG: hypothetical protein QOE19_534 [Actinomycetota bacterium]|nr:hypothetical protein [Actinomycetota bacterium]
MTQFTLTCPRCAAELSLTTRRLLVRIDAGTATSGEVLFTCLNCRRSEAVTIDVATAARLVTAGVTYLSLSEPDVDHPEPQPPGPRLTHDDLLDLHAALAGDTWHDELTGLAAETQ